MDPVGRSDAPDGPMQLQLKYWEKLYKRLAQQGQGLSSVERTGH
jgi:hypothetical protein